MNITLKCIVILFCYYTQGLLWGQDVDSQEMIDPVDTEIYPSTPIDDLHVLKEIPEILDLPYLNLKTNFKNGVATDYNIWKNVKNISQIKDSCVYQTLLLNSDSEIALILEIPTPASQNAPATWQWNAKKLTYLPQQDSELAITIIFTTDPIGDVQWGDAWRFNASRSYESGYADDMFVSKKNMRGRPIADEESLFLFNHPHISPDAGTFAWRTMYYPSYTGNTPRRYFSSTPTGSAGDVSVYAEYKDEKWCLEFRRKKFTHHSDDLPLNLDQTVLMQIRIENLNNKIWHSHVFSLPNLNNNDHIFEDISE